MNSAQGMFFRSSSFVDTLVNLDLQRPLDGSPFKFSRIDDTPMSHMSKRGASLTATSNTSGLSDGRNVSGEDPKFGTPQIKQGAGYPFNKQAKGDSRQSLAGSTDDNSGLQSKLSQQDGLKRKLSQQDGLTGSMNLTASLGSPQEQLRYSDPQSFSHFNSPEANKSRQDNDKHRRQYQPIQSKQTNSEKNSDKFHNGMPDSNQSNDGSTFDDKAHNDSSKGSTSRLSNQLVQHMFKKEFLEAAHHKFLEELLAGSLPTNKFRFFLIQEYLDLDKFIRLVAKAIHIAPEINSMQPLARFLYALTSDDVYYYSSAFKALNVKQSLADSTVPGKASESMASLYLSANSYPACIGIISAVAWLYFSAFAPFVMGERTLQTVGDAKTNRPGYISTFIDLHANEEVEKLVNALRSTVDDLGHSGNATNVQSLTDSFGKMIHFLKSLMDEAYAITPQ